MWKSYYSIGEFWKNIINIVYTRIFWRGARFIRRPIHVRNKKNIRYGRNFTTGYWNRLNVMGKLLIGDDVILGDFAQIEAFSKVEIGDGTLIASRVFIGDTSHGIYKGETASDIEIPPNKREIVSEGKMFAWYKRFYFTGCFFGRRMYCRGKFCCNPKFSRRMYVGRVTCKNHKAIQ